MTKPKKKRLNDVAKAFVVKELACFGSPKEVSEALMEELGVQLAPQNIEAYDPGKRAGQHLSEKWRELFALAREGFLEQVQNSIPLAHRSVRIKKLALAAKAFEKQKNYLGMSRILEQIAKEVGNVHTNRMELTGKDRGPIRYAEVSDMTDEQIEAELRTFGIDPATIHAAPKTKQ